MKFWTLLEGASTHFPCIGVVEMGNGLKGGKRNSEDCWTLAKCSDKERIFRASLKVIGPVVNERSTIFSCA